jgi:hypothetical protein
MAPVLSMMFTNSPPVADYSAIPLRSATIPAAATAPVPLQMSRDNARVL